MWEVCGLFLKIILVVIGSTGNLVEIQFKIIFCTFEFIYAKAYMHTVSDTGTKISQIHYVQVFLNTSTNIM